MYIYEYDNLRKQQFDSFIRDEMKAKRQEAINSLRGYVSEDIAHEFLDILSVALLENNKTALILANKLGLDQEHFIDNEDDYSEYYRKWQEVAYAESEYYV